MMSAMLDPSPAGARFFSHLDQSCESGFFLPDTDPKNNIVRGRNLDPAMITCCASVKRKGLSEK